MTSVCAFGASQAEMDWMWVLVAEYSCEVIMNVAGSPGTVPTSNRCCSSSMVKTDAVHSTHHTGGQTLILSSGALTLLMDVIRSHTRYAAVVLQAARSLSAAIHQNKRRISLFCAAFLRLLI